MLEGARLAAAQEGVLDAKISNFFIGGETNNVLLVAPSGARNISFGLGMDNVTINSLAISSLRANRDATNSNVTVSRSIANMVIGGPVEDTNVNVGVSQSLETFLGYQVQIPTAIGTVNFNGGVFHGQPMPTMVNRESSPFTGVPLGGVLEPFAENGGTMKVRIAGDVTNSVFSASVDPNPSGLSPSLVDTSGQIEKPTSKVFPFGAPNNIVLPRGVINAKVEGTINNSTNPLVSSTAPTDAAFFAFHKSVHLKKGPVVPSQVPYEPYVAPTVYHKGQTALKGLIKIDHIPSNLHLAKVAAKKRHK
jgi:hypothetical protein